MARLEQAQRDEVARQTQQKAVGQERNVADATTARRCELAAARLESCSQDLHAAELELGRLSDRAASLTLAIQAREGAARSPQTAVTPSSSEDQARLEKLGEERTSLKRELEGVDGDLRRVADKVELLSRRERQLQSIDRFVRDEDPSQGLDPRRDKSLDSMIRQLESAPTAGSRYTTSPAEQARVFQKQALQQITRVIDPADPQGSVARATKIVEGFAARGYGTREMDGIRKILDSGDTRTAVVQLRDTLAALEASGCLRQTRLDGHDMDGNQQKVSQIAELHEAWKLALGKATSPTDYTEVRETFWALLNPQSRDAQLTEAERRTVEAASQYILDAGYSFEDRQPGLAPRLVSDRPLSRNDCTLSLQHDIPQHLIRESGGRLDELLTKGENLRFVTARDNLHEDSVRFSRTKDHMFRVKQDLQHYADVLSDVLRSASREVNEACAARLAETRKEVRAILDRPKDIERQALESLVRGDRAQDLRALAKQKEVERQVLEEMKSKEKLDPEQDPIPFGSSRAAELQVQKGIQEQAATRASLRYEHAVAAVDEQVRLTVAEAVDRVRDALRESEVERAREKDLAELEERITELEAEAGIDKHRDERLRQMQMNDESD